MRTYLFIDTESTSHEHIVATIVRARNLDSAWKTFIKHFRTSSLGKTLDEDVSDQELRANMESYIDVTTPEGELDEGQP